MHSTSTSSFSFFSTSPVLTIFYSSFLSCSFIFFFFSSKSINQQQTTIPPSYLFTAFLHTITLLFSLILNPYIFYPFPYFALSNRYFYHHSLPLSCPLTFFLYLYYLLPLIPATSILFSTPLPPPILLCTA
ncbi:hypothetical protein L873DRAFT_473592 [Choiromyces venosus 120613-1]|uniref:Uncharacterized protein n=1 Tax=Choiromyces venosus 120613-1 TaxID=1336337 RepID=A0A3N4J8S7_9PEZI|nr:hypothetical protein L873DRAFT_473592 [Choiromyces venosus 120613-1]